MPNPVRILFDKIVAEKLQLSLVQQVLITSTPSPLKCFSSHSFMHPFLKVGVLLPVEMYFYNENLNLFLSLYLIKY